MLRLYLLGGFQIESDVGTLPPIPTLAARSLLAYLVMHHEKAHTRDLLAGMFWPEFPDATARRRLSQTLWRIRQTFQRASLECPLLVETNTIQFNASIPYWLDVEAFEGAFQGGLDASGDECWGEEEMRVRAAAALYCGDFMEGFYEDWIIFERERLRGLYLEALERLTARCKAEGYYEEALQFARQLALAEPLRESAHCEVMRLYRLLDRPQEALQQYETLKDILALELAISPSAAATAISQQVLRDNQRQRHRFTDRRIPPSPFLDSPFSIPLVGRGKEREQMIASIDSAIQRTGGFVLVGGEAGVGKSRLLQEIAQDAAWRGMQALWGWGEDRASVPSYNILSQALQAELTPLRAMQLRALVDDVWLSALANVLPNLTSLWPDLPPGIPLKPDQEQKRVHEAIARVVLALGEMTPHLLILEDVHWATETTMEALCYLAPRLSKSHILIVLSYRTGEAQARPEIWQLIQKLDELGNHRRFQLARLTDEETLELVRLGLGLRRSAPRFTARVQRETGGNPLFVLETLRVLHDEGILRRDASGAWNTPWDATTVDYAELPVPPGIREVIARRLRRLGREERSALHAAAILGDRFEFGLISGLAAMDRKMCMQAIHALISRRFLEEEPNTYRFSHNLVRQVALMEMDEAEKRRLHGAAFDLIEARHPEQVETLAYHATAGERWQQAFITNRQAGDRAGAAYAGDRAIAFYSLAMKAWTHLEAPSPQHDFLAVLHSRGEVFQETGRFQQAERDFREVIRRAEKTGDWDAQALANNNLSYLQFQRGDYDLALTLSIRAYDQARRAGSEALMARALLNSANALRNLGRSDDAIDYYRRAAAALEALQDDTRLADCLNRMGYAHFFLGQMAEAEAVMLRGLAIRRRWDDKVGLAYSLSNLSGLYAFKGDFARALEAAVEAYEVAIAAGDPYGQDAALHNLGTVHLQQGALEKAIDAFQRALVIAREIGDRPLVAEALADMGQAYAKKGDLFMARILLHESLVAQEDGGEIWYLCKIYEYLAEVNLEFGDKEAAREYARKALGVALSLNAPLYLSGTSHRIMGLVLAKTADNAPDEDPIPYFEESLRCLEMGGFHGVMARTLADYGRYLMTVEQKAERQRGAVMVKRVRSIFQTLGMSWDLLKLAGEERSATIAATTTVLLPSAQAPTGRPLRDDEWVEVIWKVAAVEDEAIPGKATRRQQRILRLLREAAAQNAAPRVTDLARALGVSPKTIKRDLAALRAAGHDARTRGSRR